MLILDVRPSPTSIGQMQSCKVQVWMDTDLYVNPTIHKITPRHILLSRHKEDDLVKVLVPCVGDKPTTEERRAAKSMLPNISAHDIIRRWYSFPSGRVVMLICNYEVLQGPETTSLRYRVVQ